MRRSLFIFHASCADGMAAAWAAHGVYPQAEYRAWRYDDPPLALEEASGRKVFILDFSFRRPVLEQIAEVAEKLLVLDHHKTAEEELQGLPYCQFDMQRSGAGLAWDVLRIGPRPWLIDYVEDRDLWRHRLPFSKEVAAAVFELPLGRPGEVPNFEPWYKLAAMRPQEVAVAGSHHRQTAERLARQIADSAQLCTLDGHFCYVATSPILHSEVGGALAQRSSEPGGPHRMGVTAHQRSDGRWAYSLRSRSYFDVSEVARKYGGGGHVQAAGFVVDEPVHRRWTPPSRNMGEEGCAP